MKHHLRGSNVHYKSETLERNGAKEILLDSHYKFERIDNMANFLDVINKEQVASFLHDDAIKIIVVVCTTHTI